MELKHTEPVLNSQPYKLLTLTFNMQNKKIQAATHPFQDRSQNNDEIMKDDRKVCVCVCVCMCVRQRKREREIERERESHLTVFFSLQLLTVLVSNNKKHFALQEPHP